MIGPGSGSGPVTNPVTDSPGGTDSPGSTVTDAPVVTAGPSVTTDMPVNTGNVQSKLQQ